MFWRIVLGDVLKLKGSNEIRYHFSAHFQPSIITDQVHGLSVSTNRHVLMSKFGVNTSIIDSSAAISYSHNIQRSIVKVPTSCYQKTYKQLISHEQ